MAEEKKTGKKQTNPLVYVGIGCLVLVVLAGIGSTLFFKFFAKKAIEGAIESKTGVDVSNVDEGKMTFTDKKTGTTVDIGSGKVPDTFPKDFPLYPGAKVVSSLSGAESGKNNGFWLTMTTGDSPDAVDAYYKNGLSTNGWTVETTFTSDSTTNRTLKKGTWSGSLAITGEGEDTQIVIILGQDEE